MKNLFSRSSGRLCAWNWVLLCAGMMGNGSFCVAAVEVQPFGLRTAADVDGAGIFLHQLVSNAPAGPVIRLDDAPQFGKSVTLSRAQIGEKLRASGMDLVATNWTGAEVVRISRATRTLSQSELLPLLQEALQEKYVKQPGELELRLTRSWVAVPVPSEELKVKVLDVPTLGVTPFFVMRFEIETAQGEKVGPWQAALQAHVWREIWVARTAVKRGEPLSSAGLARERRDMLLCREPLADFTPGDPAMEMAEPLSAGTPVLERSVRLRPVIRRGQTAAGVVQDGGLTITLNVEALEDGAPGQVIRIRNCGSRRDLTGKVMDERQVLLML